MSQVREPADCLRCRHFFVTYDPALPRGCRAFQIKSRALPSKVIQDSSGAPCQGFEPKPTTPNVRGR